MQKMVMAAKLGFSIIHIQENSIFKIRKKSFLDVIQNKLFIFMDTLSMDTGSEYFSATWF